MSYSPFPKPPCANCGKPCPHKNRKHCSRACQYAKQVGTGALGVKPTPPEQRFWKYVDKNGPVMPGMTTPCWLWTGARDKDGYGCFTAEKRRPVRAHRFSLETARGAPLSAEQEACHGCDNPPCVRPDHLFAGARGENDADKVRKGRQARGATNGEAKLTEAQVREIRDIYAAGGHTYPQLAERYGVSPCAIGFAVRRVKWRHVA